MQLQFTKNQPAEGELQIPFSRISVQFDESLLGRAGFTGGW